MTKVLDLNKTLYELAKNDPEIIEIMKELGFQDIAKPGMLNTAGRFMTIAKGASMKNIDLAKIKETFTAKGYQVVN